MSEPQADAVEAAAVEDVAAETQSAAADADLPLEGSEPAADSVEAAAEVEADPAAAAPEPEVTAKPVRKARAKAADPVEPVAEEAAAEVVEPEAGAPEPHDPVRQALTDAVELRVSEMAMFLRANYPDAAGVMVAQIAARLAELV